MCVLKTFEYSQILFNLILFGHLQEIHSITETLAEDLFDNGTFYQSYMKHNYINTSLVAVKMTVHCFDQFHDSLRMFLILNLQET